MELLTILFVVFVMSSITTLAIILAKKLLGGHVSPVFHYYIWLILIVRLLFPILPQSDFSIYNIFTENIKLSSLADRIIQPTVSEEIPTDTPDDFEFTETDTSERPSQESSQSLSLPGDYKVDELKTVHEAENPSLTDLIPLNMVVGIAYLAITVSLLTMLVIEYFTQKKMLLTYSIPCRVKEINEAAHDMAIALGIKRDVPVYIGNKSLVYGCFKRFIVLDIEMLDEYEMILAHELTHIKRHDNLTNILIAALRRIYWFNPIVTKGLDLICEDMELLCDKQAINRFKIRKDEYAMLLYKSVKMNDERETKLVAAASMSTAGRQLIKRLSFLNRNSRTKLTALLLSLVMVVAICSSCLTNPILAEEENHAETYMNIFASMAASGLEATPAAEDKITAGAFIDMMLLALDNSALPKDAADRLAKIKDGGAEYFLNDMIAAEYKNERPAAYTNFISTIDLDGAVTNEQAAFLMNHMLIYLTRDTLYEYDEDGNIDPKLYIPSMVDPIDFEEIIAAVEGKESGALNAKKLKAFYTEKNDENIPKIDELGNPLTEEELEEKRIQLQTVFPIVDAIKDVLIFDPFSSKREVNMIAQIIKGAGYNFTDTQGLHDMHEVMSYTFPTVLPYVIGEVSYLTNLIGTIKDDELKADVEALYIYDEIEKLYHLDETADAGTVRTICAKVARNSSYTYEQMLEDHALNGFSLLDVSNNDSSLSFADVYPSADEVPTYLAEEAEESGTFLYGGGKYTCIVFTEEAFEKILSKLTDQKDIDKLNSYYVKKDPDDSRLTERAKREMIDKFGEFKCAVYIGDPYANERDIAKIDQILAKVFESDDREIRLMPVRNYTEYKDESQIDHYALNSVRELNRFGILEERGIFNPNAKLEYQTAAEMVAKFISGLIVY